jgi:excisionase family DNA binding protein
MTRNAGDLSDLEVARALGKSVRTVQRWCESGKLPGAYKAGRSWRIPRASLPRAHSGAVGRFERGPLGELVESLRVTSERLERAGDHMTAADPQTLERLLKLLEGTGLRITAVGKLAAEQKRALSRGGQFAGRARSRT